MVPTQKHGYHQAESTPHRFRGARALAANAGDSLLARLKASGRRRPSHKSRSHNASHYGKKSPGAIHLRSFFVQVPSMQHPAELSPLGKSSAYVATYSPQVLFPISRAPKWAELGVTAETLPYQGVDIWNCYELSWLLPSGKPVVAIGEFAI